MIEQFDQLYAMVVPLIGRIIWAVVVLIIGLRLIKIVSNYIEQKSALVDIDPTLRTSVMPLVITLLKILLGITIASMLGAEMTSFIAILGAAGFAVGLALQGSLANFGGGVLILLFKPFVVGDVIEAQGYLGKVKQIQIFYTILDTPDNRKIVIPNNQLSSASAINYSAYPTRRIEWKFGVSYSSDVLAVKALLQKMVADHPMLLADPEPLVVLSEHGDSALVFTVRAWCNSADYWPTYFDMMERVKLAFDDHAISIPFPQMDVHVDKL